MIFSLKGEISQAMKDLPQRQIVWPTSRGNVVICANCAAESIRSFHFNRQFGTHAHYKSLYTRRESLEQHAHQPGTGVTLALSAGKDIIGFGVLAYPEPEERWSKLGGRLMVEVKAIEVSRDWRSAGVAGGIVKTMLSDPLVEDKIVYMVGYSWTWDLDGTGKTAQDYRRMLIALFEPHGFQEYETNEPNICLKPENMLLGRIGKNVSSEQQTNFKWLRFNIYPDA